MKRISRAIVRATIAALFTYLLAGGATFNGVLFPEMKELTLGWMAMLTAAWIWVRWRRGWTWHRTALEGVMLLWVLSFLLSLVANIEIWRRIAIGLWYVSLYIAVWYVLHDLLANRAVSRDLLIEGFLIGGGIVLYFAYRQLYSFVMTQPDTINALLHLPRPVGTIGNPNALGGFLIVLIPLILTRLLTITKRIIRLLLGLYAVTAIVLLVLSASRGAWVGLASGLALWGTLLLARRQLLSPSRLGGWWHSRKTHQKIVSLSAGFAVLTLVLVIAAILVRSFATPGREVFWRTNIYDAAIQLFLEKPVFGHGLFTFGRGLARMLSMPPETAHSHAHDIPLQLAAEQGIVGLTVLVITLVTLLRAIRRNWITADTGDHSNMIGGAIAAVTAFGVHQLIDIPAMMPAIALSGLLALVLAVAPESPSPLPTTWQRRGLFLGVTCLLLVLLISGFSSLRIYREYVAILREGIQTEDFRRAAEQMQAVIDSDPSLALYHLEQGELFGLAASRGDLDAARAGTLAYQRFIALEPDYAVAWANLAALYWQLDERKEAIDAMQRAVDLAPESWQLAFNLGNYLEAVGEADSARVVYTQVFFTPHPCVTPKPLEWEATALRREVLASRQVTCVDDNVDTISDEVLRAIGALLTNDRSAALSWLSRAEQRAVSGLDHAWVRLGYARLARHDGDHTTAERELDRARALSQRGFLDNDYIEGINIAHSQYLRTAIQRLFLPQVYFPTNDPVLQRLIAET